MVIRKNFKIISEDKKEKTNSQDIIQISNKEKQNIQSCLTNFFSSIKTLLSEGAVVIGEDEGERTIEEDFIQNPYSKQNAQSIYGLLLKVLPEQKATAFRSKIEGVKMTENYDFKFEMNEENELKNYLEKIISAELKVYAKELPQIMETRRKNLQLLCDARPDVKKYLENTKK